MERYQPRGSYSYKPTLSLLEVEAALSQLSQNAPIRTLRSALSSGELFLVGGTVRDAFIGVESGDLDLTTNLAVSKVRELLISNGIRVVDTGVQHGTVLAVIEDTHIEITTFREPTDRNTQINADDITTDLSGRDFTINALAFDLKTLKVIDPFKGIDDLNTGTLRAVRDPKARFTEDPLRILRMIRFGDAQGRNIDSATLKAASDLVSNLERVSVERIKHELDQILMSPCPAAGICKIKDIGALPFTIPELIPSVGFEQNRYHIHDVFDHTLAVLDRTPDDIILRWAAVFHDIGKPHTLSTDESGERHFYSHEVISTSLCWECMERLRFSRDDMKTISSIVRHHMRPLDCGPSGVRRLIRDLGDNLQLWRTFKNADSSPTVSETENSSTAQRFDAMVESEIKKRAVPSYGRLALNGEDLKLLGIKPGPKMGEILKQLEEIIIEDPSKNTKDTLLQIVKRGIK